MFLLSSHSYSLPNSAFAADQKEEIAQRNERRRLDMLDKLKFNGALFTDRKEVDFLENTNLMIELNSRDLSLRYSLLERAVLFYLVLILYSKS